MPSAQLSRSRDWDGRIRRAQVLSERYPSASELLVFYQHVAGFQKRVFEQLPISQSVGPQTAVAFREAIDVERAADHFPQLFKVVEEAGTPVLREAARALRNRSRQELVSLLDLFVREQEIDGPSEVFFARACLQPVVERESAGIEIAQGFSGSKCPVCDGLPQSVVLRPEGDGGKRFLVCSFCVSEWEFRRVLCPTCGETDYQKLPRYSADEMSASRVEACDTCKYYLKSIDMTVEGLAVPIVDEIATASLDVWALEQGYKKVELNLMGF